jgi:hypothetical protein
MRLRGRLKTVPEMARIQRATPPVIAIVAIRTTLPDPDPSEKLTPLLVVR